MQINVADYDNEFVFAWNEDKFGDRLTMMRDSFSYYETEGELPHYNDHSEDPFFDVMEALLIGEAYYRLEPLGYLIDNPVSLKLISKSYSLYGVIELNVIPCDATGKMEADED